MALSHVLVHASVTRNNGSETIWMSGAGISGNYKKSHGQESTAAGDLAQSHAGLQGKGELLSPHKRELFACHYSTLSL